MTPALKVAALQKSFGKFELGPIDLEIQPGTVLGFVGANGAGKSTTIHCLLGLLKPDRGDIQVCGEAANPNAGAWKRNVGFVLSQQGFYERSTVAENLKFFASFYPDWDHSYAETVLKRLALDTAKKAKDLSTGDRMKLALAAALSHRPRLLIMDEPTANLDPIVRAEVIDLIADLLRSGDHAVFMSTHILGDIAAVADDIAFIHNGRIVSATTKDTLLEAWRRISFRAQGALPSLPGIVKMEQAGSLHMVTTDDAEQMLAVLKQANAEILESNRLDLGEISIHILQRARR